MQDVSNQMFERFTEAVRAELEKPVASVPSPAASAPPIEVSSVVMRQPVFWIAVLAVLAILYWLWIR